MQTITFQFLLQSATPVSVIVGFVGLINTINNYRRQLTAQIFMKYTERYERILGEFPPDALAARFNEGVLPPESSQLRLCVLRYLNLCSEEFYLTSNGYLNKSLWRIWECDLKRIIASPLVRREWPALGGEFQSHASFLAYVDHVHAEVQIANAAALPR